MQNGNTKNIYRVHSLVGECTLLFFGHWIFSEG